VALEVAALVYTIREEVPDTAAALRLPALEVTDTIEEMGSLRYTQTHIPEPGPRSAYPNPDPDPHT
jgi:hypothetical protein